MAIQKIKNILLVAVLIIQLYKCNCDNNYDNAFLSNRQYKRCHNKQYATISHLLPLMPHMSFHSNLHYLPDKAIYCTRPVNSNTGHYEFLQKYYSAIKGKSDFYVNTLKCIYPRSVEFAELPDEEPLKSIEKFQEAILTQPYNFKNLVDKVNKGEQPEPYKTIDVEALAEEIVNDIFHPKPNSVDALEGSALNGIICEHLKFNETHNEGMVLEIKRPICYPAQRPPISTTVPSTTTKYPTVTTVTENDEATFLNKACYVLCHTGLIYQILSCCRK